MGDDASTKTGLGGHRAAKRALELIEQVAASPEPTSLAELARRLNLPKSSAHALARTLGDEGYLARDERGAYSLGPRLLSLLGRLPDRFELPRVARPIMQELTLQLGETTLLGVRRNHSIFYIEQVESQDFIRYVAPLGESRPLYCTSIGKVHLANLPREEVETLLDGIHLDARTVYTRTHIAAILADLDAVRSQGYALNREESVVGVVGIAVAIREGGQPTGRLVAGLSLTGPAERMSSKLAQMPAPLVEAAARIGAGVKPR